MIDDSNDKWDASSADGLVVEFSVAAQHFGFSSQSAWDTVILLLPGLICFSDTFSINWHIMRQFSFNVVAGMRFFFLFLYLTLFSKGFHSFFFFKFNFCGFVSLFPSVVWMWAIPPIVFQSGRKKKQVGMRFFSVTSHIARASCLISIFPSDFEPDTNLCIHAHVGHMVGRQQRDRKALLSRCFCVPWHGQQESEEGIASINAVVHYDTVINADGWNFCRSSTTFLFFVSYGLESILDQTQIFLIIMMSCVCFTFRWHPRIIAQFGLKNPFSILLSTRRNLHLSPLMSIHLFGWKCWHAPWFLTLIDDSFYFLFSFCFLKKQRWCGSRHLSVWWSEKCASLALLPPRFFFPSEQRLDIFTIY